MKKLILLMMVLLVGGLAGCSDKDDGMLKISSDPGDAEVYIDGERKGNTPAKKGQTYAIKLSEGEHTIEIIKSISEADEYYGKKTVFVAEKSLQTVSLSLNKRQKKVYTEKMRKAAADALPTIQEQMVTIPSGSFQMGSGDGDSDERPVHTVHINSFKMGKYEVTQAQWLAVMGSQPSRFKGINNPVEEVSWDDIQEFIRKLNSHTGQKFRLPTEAEWEYAARAGSTTKYSWGDTVGNNMANCDGCGSQWDDSRTAPVGSFQPNAFGLYDMHGNVHEWLQDCWNGSYSGAPSNGKAWLSGECGLRVLRGGSWSDDPNTMRSPARASDYAADHHRSVGFRLVQD